MACTTSILKHVISAALFTFCAAAIAQNYPSKPIQIVSPFPPGGGTDIIGRLIAQKLGEKFNLPAIVENRAGGNGTIGLAHVARAPADGHTIVLVPPSFAVNPSIYKKPPYNQADLAPVSILASGPLVLVVNGALPAQSIGELIALAKAKPGVLNYGSPGAGGLPHLTAELFNSMAGIKMVNVPYKGPANAVADLVSGNIQVYYMAVVAAMPLMKTGKVRALGVSSAQRTSIAPELPTIAEAGVKDFDMTNWYGLLVPTGTPADVIDKLQREVALILNLPELKEKLAGQGMTVVASTAKAFSDFLVQETAKYKRLIATANIELQ